jgi:hypothetical protein
LVTVTGRRYGAFLLPTDTVTRYQQVVKSVNNMGFDDIEFAKILFVTDDGHCFSALDQSCRLRANAAWSSKAQPLDHLKFHRYLHIAAVHYCITN